MHEWEVDSYKNALRNNIDELYMKFILEIVIMVADTGF
jgi:hypothetical protein